MRLSCGGEERSYFVGCQQSFARFAFRCQRERNTGTSRYLALALSAIKRGLADRQHAPDISVTQTLATKLADKLPLSILSDFRDSRAAEEIGPFCGCVTRLFSAR